MIRPRSGCGLPDRPLTAARGLGRLRRQDFATDYVWIPQCMKRNGSHGIDIFMRLRSGVRYPTGRIQSAGCGVRKMRRLLAVAPVLLLMSGWAITDRLDITNHHLGNCTRELSETNQRLGRGIEARRRERPGR